MKTKITLVGCSYIIGNVIVLVPSNLTVFQALSVSLYYPCSVGTVSLPRHLFCSANKARTVRKKVKDRFPTKSQISDYIERTFTAFIGNLSSNSTESHSSSVILPDSMNASRMLFEKTDSIRSVGFEGTSTPTNDTTSAISVILSWFVTRA